MNHLEILIPFGAPPVELAGDLLRELNAPALATLCARARSEGAASRHESCEEFSRALPHESWLVRQFGLGKELQLRGSPPVAPFLMQSRGLHPTQGTWFILQPVHIHIARDHLVLTDPRQLVLSDEESRILFGIAAPLFEEAGKSVQYGDACTWFLRADEWAQLQTSSPDAVAGHNIDIWMPKGPGERDWRRVQNDVQMHWFDHPLNATREDKGLKAINSLWLWGAASTTLTPPQGPYSRLFNFSDWMQGLQSTSGESGNASAADEVLAHGSGRSLAILDKLMPCALVSDWGRWLEEMQKLETRWFEPLLNALKSGRLDALTLVLTTDTRISRFTVTRNSLRKFWIKPTLSNLMP